MNLLFKSSERTIISYVWFLPGARRTQKIDLAHYEEKMMQKSQSDIRIRLNEAEDEELDDEDFDEDIDEDCLNRRHVKYNSEQIVEKQQKKLKKRQMTNKKK